MDTRKKALVITLLLLICYTYYRVVSKTISLKLDKKVEGFSLSIPDMVKNATAPYTTKRLQTCLSTYPKADPQFEKIPLTYKNKYFNNRAFDLMLCDFYIAGSYKSYIPCGYTRDTQAYDAIKRAIQMGARILDLDLYSNNSLENPEIEIRVETPLNNKYATPLEFNKVCNLISREAWKGNNYPLILMFNMNFNNKYLYQKMAKQLLESFRDRLIHQKYGFKRYNMGQVPIKEMIGRVIIILNKYPNDGLLDELTNEAASDKHQYLKRMEYTDANINYGGINATETDGMYTINYNKFNLTFVHHNPEHSYENVINLKHDINNIDASDPRKYGMHSVLMYYNKDDNNMRNYLDYFKTCSFVVKPDNLRHIPKPKKPIKKQDTRLSYAPKSTTVAGIGGVPWLVFNH